MVTVLIPTFGRPKFLRQALASVRAQSAIAAITEVVVSENGGSDESKSVVNDFGDLPIRYVFRNPQLGLLEHHKELLCNCSANGLLAVLHDDDWWLPAHLEIGLAVLKDPKTNAVFSEVFESDGPQCPLELVRHNYGYIAWAASGFNFGAPVVNFDAVGALLAGMIETTFHFSSLIGRSELVRQAFLKVWETGNPYDFDRPFPVLLAGDTNIAFVTTPHVVVRIHADQDQHRYSTRNSLLKAETTRWMRRRWPKEMQEAVNRFNTAIGGVTPAISWRVSNLVGGPHKTMLIEECGLNLLRPPPAVPPAKDAKWLIKQMTPPALLALKRRIIKFRGSG